MRKREIHERDWVDMLNMDIGRSFSPVSFPILEAQAKIKFVSKPDEGKTLEGRLFFIFNSPQLQVARKRGGMCG